MAYGFQTGAFQSPGFQQTVAEAAAVGSVHHGARFLRVFKVGNREFAIDDRGRLEWMIQEEITKPPERPIRLRKKLPVNLEKPGGLVAIPEIELPNVNWSVVEMIREKATRQDYPAILEALDRVIERMRDDEEAAYWLLM